MHIYLTKNPAKLHPDPICNNVALGLFWSVLSQQEQEQQKEPDE